MAQVLQDAIEKKAGASKRPSDVAASATGLATSAAAVAASKRSRASLSSGPVVGPGGACCIIRAPVRHRKGHHGPGWLATCDEVPSGGP